ncbi:hypothetical protein ACSBR2_025986 [Camellia fascicularis]
MEEKKREQRGGWIPMIKRRGRHEARINGLNEGLFIVFVDNMHNSMNPKGLYMLFMKFGIVKNVFNSSSQRFKIAGVGRNRLQVRDHRSFVEVVNTKTNQDRASPTVTVSEVGNGWLYESVIIRLKANLNAHELKKELRERGVGDVLVRDRGDRDVVATFNLKDEMKSKLSLFYPYIHEWCEFITEWKSGLQLEQDK